MEKVSKKSLKSSKKNEIKLEKKVISLLKKEKEETEIVSINNIKVENIQVEDCHEAEFTNDNEIVIEKVKKSKKHSKKDKIIDNIQEIIATEQVVLNNTEIVNEKPKKSKKNKNSEIESMEVNNEMDDIVEIKTADTPMYNAIIANLPSEASQEELTNFLSNRGIPIDGLQLNDNKYAIIETDNPETLNQIITLLQTKPMKHNKSMTASQLFGNPLKLANFATKVSVPNKRIVTVKNVSKHTNIDDVIATIEYKDEIVKHSSVIVRNRGKETLMLIIEFKSVTHIDEIMAKLNETVVDERALTAEYKCNLTDPDQNESGTKSDTFIIRNMPLSCTKESIMELLKNFEVSPKNIELSQKFGRSSCYVKFRSATKASEAFDKLKEELVEGVKLDIKFVVETKAPIDGELARTKLHITNLPFTVKKEDIEKEFDMAESIKFPTTAAGKSKGCCYLNFKTEEMAALAMDGFQDKVIGGRKIKCEYLKVSSVSEDMDNSRPREKKLIPNKEKQVGTVLTLYNLPAGVTQKDIIAHFSHVTMVNIVMKGDSFRGIAEVHFNNVASATAAMYHVPEFSMRGRVIRKELKGGSWRIGTMTKKVPKVFVKKNPTAEERDSDSMDS